MRPTPLALAAALLPSIAFAQPNLCPLTGAELPPDLAVCPATGVAPDAFSPTPSLHWPLDVDTGGFVAGEGVALRTHAGEAAARVGAGCLEVDLSAAPRPGEGGGPGVLLPNPPRPVGGVSFWARSPEEGRIAVIAAEEDGSLYITAVLLPAGRWQPIVIDTQGMILGDNATDENGQLDRDQIAFLGLVDVSAVPGLGSGRTLDTLYVDDLKLYAEPLRREPLRVPGGLSFGHFGYSSVGWMVLGAASYSVLSMDAVRPWVAQLNSTEAEGPTGLLACLPVYGAQAPWTAIQFDAWSEQPCTLAVLVREDTGGQYVQVAQPRLTSEWQTLVLQATGFQPDTSMPDTHNGVLDTDRVQVVLFLELESVQPVGARGNVLQLTRPLVVTAP